MMLPPTARLLLLPLSEENVITGTTQTSTCRPQRRIQQQRACSRRHASPIAPAPTETAIFSLIAPKFQFKGANKRGIPVSRDPAALLAKYSDPLVYTGPIRVRTGHEILRISSFLLHNLKKVTVPFMVLHGTADRVTDPLASQDLYNEAASRHKDMRLYEGFLHDLLFEPERDEIAADIIEWMDRTLALQSV